MPIEASDMMVILKDKRNGLLQNFRSIGRKMGVELNAIPGITAGFQYPVKCDLMN